MNQIRNNFLTLLFALMIMVAAGSVFYKFYFAKNYDFTVEVSCNPETESCLERDCESEECPPNGFETFQTYVISAKNFKYCTNDDCTEFCRVNSNKCKVLSDEE